MDDGRHFKNPFPEASSDEIGQVLVASKDSLTAELVAELKESVSSLLQLLERDISRDIDWGDVSVYTGCSGYSLLYLHLAEVLDNSDTYLKKAQPIAEKCAKKIKGRRHTFLCGDAGPLAIAAVVFSRLNMKDEVTACIDGLKKLEKDILNPSSGVPDEILYGRAGYLYALAFLQQKISKDIVDDKVVRSVIAAMLDSGSSMARREKLGVPLMFEWHEKKYLGAAHGLMGIMFMLLQVL